MNQPQSDAINDIRMTERLVRGLDILKRRSPALHELITQLAFAVLSQEAQLRIIRATIR